MANKPGEANFFPDVPEFPSMGVFQPIYGKFDLTTYIQGASDYEIMAFLVGKYNACLEAYGTVTKLSTDTVKACKQLQDWINNWFTNLDVQQELNNKIDSMVQDGSFGRLLHQTFDAQINQQTANSVTAWLVANVTPTGSAVVVDKSLSIEGAAANSRTIGNELAAISNRSELSFTSHNNTGIFKENGIKGEANNFSTVNNFTLNQNECIILTANVPDYMIPIGLLNGDVYTDVATNINGDYYYRATTKCTVSCTYITESGCKIIKGVFTHNATLNALDFGFVNDGITDNSSVMDKFVKLADTTPIVFPYGKYIFSKNINFPNHFYIKLENATFEVSDDFSDDYFLTFRKDSTASDYAEGSYFTGGRLSCRYKPKVSCIGCYKLVNSVISNVIINNVKVGIKTSTGTEPDGAPAFKGITIDNDQAISGSVGIFDNAFDSNFDDISIVNFTTAIKTYAGRFNNIRAWMRSAATIGESLFAVIDGYDISFSNCAIDTYRYAFSVPNAIGGACLSNILVIRNTGVYPNSTVDIEPPIFLLHQSPTPFLLGSNIAIVNDYKYTIFDDEKDANFSKLVNVRLGNKIIS